MSQPVNRRRAASNRIPPSTTYQTVNMTKAALAATAATSDLRLAGAGETIAIRWHFASIGQPRRFSKTDSADDQRSQAGRGIDPAARARAREDGGSGRALVRLPFQLEDVRACGAHRVHALDECGVR